MKSIKLPSFETVAPLIAIGALLMLISTSSFAYGETAPWDGALCWLVGALKGKTAIAVATIAFIAAAAGFIWGEQLTGIFKTLVNIFVATSIMIGSGAIVNLIASKVGDGITMGCT